MSKGVDVSPVSAITVMAGTGEKKRDNTESSGELKKQRQQLRGSARWPTLEQKLK